MFEAAGRTMLAFFAWIGDLSRFMLEALRRLFRRPFEVRETLRQIGEVGWMSLPLMAASGLAVGAVMSMHTRAAFERFGAEYLIPGGLAIAIIRETGPLTTGILVAGRVGASIGAELGAMRVTEQIDALESLAVDSVKYLAVTRIAACTLALPLLTLVMDFTAIVGGYLAERSVSGMPFRLFMDRAWETVEFEDYVLATLKTSVFGFLIGSVSSFVGFRARGGSAGVGRASTQSVVYSSLILILVNVLLVRSIALLLPHIAR